jgi:hypothetical protein
MYTEEGYGSSPGDKATLEYSDKAIKIKPQLFVPQEAR